MHAQAPPAVPADGDALQQCRAFSHGASGPVWAGTDVFPDAPLVSLKGLPVNEARMVIVKEDGPFGTSPLANAFAQASILIDIAFVACFSISIDTRINGIS